MNLTPEHISDIIKIGIPGLISLASIIAAILIQISSNKKDKKINKQNIAHQTEIQNLKSLSEKQLQTLKYDHEKTHHKKELIRLLIDDITKNITDYRDLYNRYYIEVTVKINTSIQDKNNQILINYLSEISKNNTLAKLLDSVDLVNNCKSKVLLIGNIELRDTYDNIINNWSEIHGYIRKLHNEISDNYPIEKIEKSLKDIKNEYQLSNQNTLKLFEILNKLYFSG